MSFNDASKLRLKSAETCPREATRPDPTKIQWRKNIFVVIMPRICDYYNL